MLFASPRTSRSRSGRRRCSPSCCSAARCCCCCATAAAPATPRRRPGRRRRWSPPHAGRAARGAGLRRRCQRRRADTGRRPGPRLRRPFAPHGPFATAATTTTGAAPPTCRRPPKPPQAALRLGLLTFSVVLFVLGLVGAGRPRRLRRAGRRPTSPPRSRVVGLGARARRLDRPGPRSDRRSASCSRWRWAAATRRSTGARTGRPAPARDLGTDHAWTHAAERVPPGRRRRDARSVRSGLQPRPRRTGRHRRRGRRRATSGSSCRPTWTSIVDAKWTSATRRSSASPGSGLGAGRPHHHRLRRRRPRRRTGAHRRRGRPGQPGGTPMKRHRTDVVSLVFGLPVPRHRGLVGGRPLPDRPSTGRAEPGLDRGRRADRARPPRGGGEPARRPARTGAGRWTRAFDRPPSSRSDADAAPTARPTTEPRRHRLAHAGSRPGRVDARRRTPGRSLIGRSRPDRGPRHPGRRREAGQLSTPMLALAPYGVRRRREETAMPESLSSHRRTALPDPDLTGRGGAALDGRLRRAPRAQARPGRRAPGAQSPVLDRGDRRAGARTTRSPWWPARPTDGRPGPDPTLAGAWVEQRVRAVETLADAEPGRRRHGRRARGRRRRRDPRRAGEPGQAPEPGRRGLAWRWRRRRSSPAAPARSWTGRPRCSASAATWCCATCRRYGCTGCGSPRPSADAGRAAGPAGPHQQRPAHPGHAHRLQRRGRRGDLPRRRRAAPAGCARGRGCGCCRRWPPPRSRRSSATRSGSSPSDPTAVVAASDGKVLGGRAHPRRAPRWRGVPADRGVPVGARRARQPRAGGRPGGGPLRRRRRLRRGDEAGGRAQRRRRTRCWRPPAAPSPSPSAPG